MMKVKEDLRVDSKRTEAQSTTEIENKTETLKKRHAIKQLSHNISKHVHIILIYLVLDHQLGKRKPQNQCKMTFCGSRIFKYTSKISFKLFQFTYY